MPERTAIGRRTFLELAVAAAGAAGLESVMPGFAGAAAKAPEKLGAQFIGKLEGPEIIRDVAKFPKKFGEAPMLAELVKAGKLPPVDKRLPDPNDLMVVKPLKEIGKYGGRWRRGFTGPADNENGNRIVSTDKILMWDYTGNKVAPSLAKDWRLSDDGTVCTIFLRRGLKWSDGAPSPRTTSSSGTRRSTRTRPWCRRRHRNLRSMVSRVDSPSGTTTPWSSSSPSPTSSSWTSWPETPSSAADRPPRWPGPRSWVPMLRPTTSSNSCPSTPPSTRRTGRRRLQASTAG